MVVATGEEPSLTFTAAPRLNSFIKGPGRIVFPTANNSPLSFKIATSSADLKDSSQSTTCLQKTVLPNFTTSDTASNTETVQRGLVYSFFFPFPERFVVDSLLTLPFNSNSAPLIEGAMLPLERKVKSRLPVDLCLTDRTRPVLLENSNSRSEKSSPRLVAKPKM